MRPSTCLAGYRSVSVSPTPNSLAFLRSLCSRSSRLPATLSIPASLALFLSSPHPPMRRLRFYSPSDCRRLREAQPRLLTGPPANSRCRRGAFTRRGAVLELACYPRQPIGEPTVPPAGPLHPAQLEALAASSSVGVGSMLWMG